MSGGAFLAESRFFSTDAAPGCLFHAPEFYRLHEGGVDSAYFEWVLGTDVLARIHFTEHEAGLWRSPARGTFAGYAWHPELSPDELRAFHDAVEARLWARGAQCIEILPAPLGHDAQAFSNQFYLLRSAGYSVSRCDLNQDMTVDARPLGERMSSGNRKRLAKCLREGLETRRVGLEQLAEVYDTIACNRAAKGHPVSMSLAQLNDMVGLFGERIVLFACRNGAQMLASAICLQLDQHVLYVFYWGDRPGHSTRSPVVSVADAIYRHCQLAGVQVLDVGTSTLDTLSNSGLLHFKRGLGFGESLKLRMEKRR
jgi:hypothetical protein